MPQTPSVFGPISGSATVASNTATVTFQAVGGPKRITNLFANVSTQTLQAQCSIYVGFVSTGSRVYQSQSGSTGFSARGNIDLIDGQTLFVVWTGADNGASATATFTGHDLDFSEVGNSSITGEDPIAADDGTLIFPAIKSTNFVTGVSGWNLDRTGNAELNNVTVRGTLDVEDVSDGTYVKIYDENPGDGAVIDITTSRLRHGTSPNTGFIGLQIQGPPVGTRQPRIELGQTGTGASDMYVSADNIEFWLTAGGELSINGLDGGRGVVSSGGLSASSGAIGNTETDLFTLTNFTFEVGRAYRFEYWGMSTVSLASNRPLFRLRKVSGGTQMVAGSCFVGTLNSQCETPWGGYFYVDPAGSNLALNMVVSVIGSAAFNVTALSPSGATITDIGPYTAVNSFATLLS